MTDPQLWSEWKTKAESLIDHVRAYDADAKIIVSGIHYAYDISFAASNPINRSDIVYGIHPYPDNGVFKTDGFSNVKSTYPVFATEFGFDPNTDKHYKGDTQYGNDAINYLEINKISWTVWNFSPYWFPELVTDWSYNPSVSGTLFKSKLLILN